VITHRHPIALEVLRLTALLAAAAVGITVGLPFLLALAATAGH
jgi:hypothetical protein